MVQIPRCNLVRPPRRDGAEKLKRWSEEVLPLYADGFRALINCADSIAKDDVTAYGVLCDAFNELMVETHGRVWV